MAIAEKLDQDFLLAYKAKETLTVDVLRMLKSALKNKQIELGRALTDEDVIGMIRSEMKKRADAIESYVAGGRQELADKEKAEVEMLKKYLPAELSEDDVRAKALAIIETLSDEDKANFGKAMGKVMSELKGQADGGQIGKVVKDLLSK